MRPHRLADVFAVYCIKTVKALRKFVIDLFCESDRLIKEAVSIKYLRDFIYGVILGITNIVPGVSGGTMAVLLNIYDKILYAISILNIKKNLSFLIPLGLGGLCGIFLFSKAMVFLLGNYEMPMYFCFMGMILGSVPMIYKRAKYEKVKIRNGVICAGAFAFMIFLAAAENGTLLNKTLAQFGGVSAQLLAWLFFAAFISTIAMLLPGISGSLTMLLFGVYAVTMEAISTFNFTILAVVGAGVLLGAFVGIKLIKLLLRFHPQALYCGILGLIVGSLFTIYPGFRVDTEGILSIILMVAFAGLTYWFSKKSQGDGNDV